MLVQKINPQNNIQFQSKRFQTFLPKDGKTCENILTDSMKKAIKKAKRQHKEYMAKAKSNIKDIL